MNLENKSTLRNELLFDEQKGKGRLLKSQSSQEKNNLTNDVSELSPVCSVTLKQLRFTEENSRLRL